MIPQDLATLPDRADARGLGPVSVMARTGSTNADLKVFARAGAAHGTALVADAQDGGRGRLGRSWASPPGANLHLSVLIRHPLPVQRVPLLCLGAAAVLAECAGTELHIKWPNDLLAPDGRKVAGLLAEAEPRGGRLDWLVLGIGVNVRSAPDGLDAAHLSELGSRVTRCELALALLEGVAELPVQLQRAPENVLRRWRAHAFMLGRRVRVAGKQGIAVDVDEDGALILDTGGRTERILAGDVEMIGLA